MTRGFTKAGRAWAASVVLAAVAIGLWSIGAGSAPAGAPAPTPQSWAFAIGNGTLAGDATAVGDRYGAFDMVVVDGEEATAQQVAAIRAEGTIALGYLSVGTIERWRSWYPELRSFRLRAWQDWKDEWFADTARPALRRKLLRIADETLIPKGFDGLFLDNVDMVEVKRHRAQRRGMAALVEDLDGLVGSSLLFAQNGARGVLRGYEAQGVGPLGTHLDGWNREDVTWTYDFDRRRYARTPKAERRRALSELSKVAAEGLLTTATDYVDLRGGIGAGECRAVENALGAGALPYLADIALTKRAVAVNPPDC